MSNNSNSIFPETGLTAKTLHPMNNFINEDKSPTVLIPSNKPEMILHPEIFHISSDTLVNFIKETEKRKFSEEIDVIEQIGGDKFIEQALATNFIRGISENEEEIQKRSAEFGTNKREDKIPDSFWQLLKNALEDFTLRILIVCSIVSIVAETVTAEESRKKTAWIDGFAILIAVFACSFVQATNDYQKELQFQKLNKVADGEKKLTVIREGKMLVLHHSLILVGDLINITEGMDVPADGLVIEASELLCDESAMTGETEPIKKAALANCIKKRNDARLEEHDEAMGYHHVPSPIMLSGSKVLTGEGKFIVIVVGPKSCLGRIQSKLDTDIESTPLQMKLEHLARQIAKFGFYSALLILVILLIRFTITRIQDGSFHSENVNDLIRFVLIAITVVAVAIPEGLPLSVVISLAYSVKKMLKDNNLVRRLHACETMGGANMICSDKTGTLTQNEMTFTDFYNEKRVSIDTFNKNPLSYYFPDNMKDLFLQIGIVNSSAFLRPLKGSSTEIALLKFVENCNENYEGIRNSYHIEQKFPFSSSRKRMGMILNINDTQRRLVEKGASELILDCCNKIHIFSTNEVIPLTENIKKNILNAIEDMAKDALRTLIFAYKDLNGSENMAEKDQKGVYQLEKTDLILFMIIGIRDIIRREVPQAVSDCISAGIKVRMVTGDNKITARAIAKECHIINASDENSLVLEGVDFMTRIGGVVCSNCQTAECNCPTDSKTAEKAGKKVRVDTIKNANEFNKIYPFLDVLARSRPEDKYAMVVGLKERGNVVAVTGDGTNDAPALKKADVGFAMGICGTEVAREAAAIILLDDNFSSIVKAVMWGRNIYDSIRKFLQFQLTVNVVAVGVTLIGASVIQQEILYPIQMLWVNLIMDTFASLALATEPPNLGLLKRKPHNKNEHIVSKKMFKHIAGQAIYQIIIMMILVFHGENFIPEYSDSFDDAIRDRNVTMTVKYGENNHIRSGRYFQIKDSSAPDYLDLEYDWGPSRHFTMIFNTFVWMQIFDFFNARRIEDEFNIFAGFFNNTLFLIIVTGIVLFQGVIVTHGSWAFHCYKWYDDNTGGAGLNIYQWLICIAFGSGSLVVGFLIKLIPEGKCLEMGSKSIDPSINPSKILEMRRGSSNKIVKQSTIIQKSSFKKTSKPSSFRVHELNSKDVVQEETLNN